MHTNLHNIIKINTLTVKLAAFWNLYKNTLFILKIKVMSKGKLVTGVLAGAAAGAILGILLAPDKGSETRKKIAKKGNDLSGSVKDGIGKIGESINNKYQNIKGDAKEMMNEVKENGIELKEDQYGQKAF